MLQKKKIYKKKRETKSLFHIYVVTLKKSFDLLEISGSQQRPTLTPATPTNSVVKQCDI